MKIVRCLIIKESLECRTALFNHSRIVELTTRIIFFHLFLWSARSSTDAITVYVYVTAWASVEVVAPAGWRHALSLIHHRWVIKATDRSHTEADEMKARMVIARVKLISLFNFWRQRFTSDWCRTCAAVGTTTGAEHYRFNSNFFVARRTSEEIAVA